MTAPVDAAIDPLGAVVGQPAAVERLRAAAEAPVHAYLFVGPEGFGTETAARGFAALLLAPGPEPDQRATRLAVAGDHPDLTIVRREGPAISRDQARDVVRLAVRTPVEGRRKVIVLTEFHLVTDAAPILLKSLEEPPASTVFVVLADHVPPELATVASRCVRVDFGPISAAAIEEELVRTGVDADRAAAAAARSGGDLGRARLLARDDGLVARRAAWADVPNRLDGTGAAVATLVDELLTLTEDALAAVRSHQEAEHRALTDQAERYGSAPPGKALADRHRREARRLRTEELRAGLAELARAYRSSLEGGDAAPKLAALDRISAAAEALDRNPNEALLLQHLLLRVPPLR